LGVCGGCNQRLRERGGDLEGVLEEVKAAMTG
jgi:hypothetical protein